MPQGCHCMSVFGVSGLEGVKLCCQLTQVVYEWRKQLFFFFFLNDGRILRALCVAPDLERHYHGNSSRCHPYPHSECKVSKLSLTTP
jgi:hypothetical protein